MSSSSGDLLPEMMESETPPPDSSSQEAGDPEVSSRRASPDPVRTEDNPIDPRSPQRPAPEESKQKSPAPSGMRVGHSEGAVGASDHLKRTPYANGYDDGKNFVHRKRIT